MLHLIDSATQVGPNSLTDCKVNVIAPTGRQFQVAFYHKISMYIVL